MREAKEHKAETRQRITEAASGLFRKQGIDAVGVDAIMREAGLTHGGFYGHFASKEALVGEVGAAALGRSAARWAEIAGQNGKAEALARILDGYLSPDHVAATGRGCVMPTLGPELARRPHARPELTAALRTMLDTLARCLPGRREIARRRALAGLSCMVGSVILARLSSDPALAAEFLDAARHAVGPRTGPPG